MKIYTIKGIAKKPFPCAEITKKLKKAMADKTVGMILIAINSPGGKWDNYKSPNQALQLSGGSLPKAGQVKPKASTK